MRGGRLSRRARLALGVVAAAVVVVVALSAAGVGLPGPPVRDWLGLGEEGVPIACEYDADKVLTPAAPPAEPGMWRTEPELPGEERPELDAAVIGNLAYVAGGQGWEGGPVSSHPLRAMVAFDVERRRYLETPLLPAPVDHTLLVAHQGELYLVGGLRDGRAVADVWRFSPETGVWTALDPLRFPRGGHAGAVIGERLYVAGGAPHIFGNERVEPVATLEIYDFETGEWTLGPDMPTPRHHTTAAAADGILDVLGGRELDTLASTAFERFDPASGRWEELPPLPLGVGAADAVATNGAILLTGGADDEAWQEGGGFVTPATWAYTPADGRWRRLADMETPRHAHAAVAAAGRLVVFGGTPCPGFGQTRSVESLELPADLLP